MKYNNLIKGDSKKIEKEEWSWNKTLDGYWENGIFATRGEAVADALKVANIKGFKELYIGRCKTVPLQTKVNPENILHDLDEKYCDESVCEEYLYANVEKIKWLKDELEKVIKDFHRRACIEPTWFKVSEVELIDVDKITWANYMLEEAINLSINMRK